MKKLVRLFVVPALALAIQAAFTPNVLAQQAPQPAPPIVHPHPHPRPGPIGPDGGPVDPTPVEPPVGG